MNKNILGIVTLVVLSVTVSAGYYFGFSNDEVSANPDYICTKSVTNQPCIVPADAWSDWNTDGARVGTGVMTTAVTYYSTRTGCSSGYSARRGGGYTSGANGRKTADFVSSSISCTLIQEDSTPPVGEIN